MATFARDHCRHRIAATNAGVAVASSHHPENSDLLVSPSTLHRAAAQLCRAAARVLPLSFVTPPSLDQPSFASDVAASESCHCRRRLLWSICKLLQEAVVKQDSEINYSYCVYDSDIATGFGVGAFLFLMASQVLIMVASKCFCCGTPLRPGGSRALAVLLFITCWVLFFIAESCLLAGAVRNAYHTRYRTIFSETPNCETLRKGVFAAGAAFTLFTAIVSEFYHVCYSKARDNIEPYGRETGVGMGTYK